jgi:hypothetical protein
MRSQEVTLLSGDSLMERAENMKTYKLLPGFDPSAITSIPKLSKQVSIDPLLRRLRFIFTPRR